MLIQELERLSGLERPTIRYYEKEGLIKPERCENGYRSYSEEDVQTLIRIKLMRQLGLPIGKIKDLQAGDANFLALIDAQIKTLTTQIDRDIRAKTVCTAMLNDGVEYTTLDASYYMQMFENALETNKPISSFQENTPAQIHPWRRFFARMFDYYFVGVVLQFLLVVIFRIRPVLTNNRVISLLLPIIFSGLFVPIEALLVHLWGVTPGKWIFGIRIERIEGGLLSLSDSMERAKQVYISGVGLRIPLISAITMLRCFCILTGRSFWRWAKYDSISPPYDMDWDYNNEIHYDNRGGKRCIVAVCVIAVALTISVITVSDSVKPRFRGSDLTIAEFAENYNSTSAILSGDSVENRTNRLEPDGAWYESRENIVYLYLGGVPVNENPNFIYETDGSYIRSITFEQQWTSVQILNPFDNKCTTAAITMLAAQKGISIFDLVKFEKIFNSLQDKASGSLMYKNLCIEWNTETSEDLIRGGSMYYSETENGGKLSFWFRVSFVKEPV